MTAAGPGDVAGTGMHVTEAMPAGAVLVSVLAGQDADSALTALYTEHYQPLVRLAALLVGDVAAAQDAVQDAFVAVHGSWRRLRDSDRALAYLRRCVVNRSRSVVRHQGPAALEPSAEIATLTALPPRQREALVLRYYGDLAEAEIAAAMGIGRGAVRRYTAQGMAAVRSALETDP